MTVRTTELTNMRAGEMAKGGRRWRMRQAQIEARRLGLLQVNLGNLGVSVLEGRCGVGKKAAENLD